MAVIEICKEGHPALKKCCRKVREMTPQIRQLARDMADTMFTYAGIGLAANQVGADYRIIVVFDEEEKYRVVINPRIVKRSDDEEFSDEGCLSFPNVFGTVARSLEVEVSGFDVSMKKIKVKASGLLARVYQHETDHLNGIVFLERVEEGTVKKVKYDEEDGRIEEPLTAEEIEEMKNRVPVSAGAAKAE